MAPPQALARRRARERSIRASRRARRRAILVLLTFAFVITILLAAFGSSPVAYRPAEAASASALIPGRPLPEPVALQSSLEIYMPIAQQGVTAIGYHGAGEHALPLTPVGRQANEGLFSRLIHGLFGGGGEGLVYYQLGGGDGPSSGGLDVGAAAGTDVYAPVDGTIVSISPHVLDGKPYGHRVDIEPAGAPSVVVSLTHLRVDPALTVGSPVLSSTSRIGAVVDMADVQRQALARYTQDAGNHVALSVHPAATLSLR